MNIDLQPLANWVLMHTTREFLKLLYLTSGSLIVFVYIPQIVRLLRDQTGAAAISLVSWASWATLRLPAMLYALAVTNDIIMLVITTGDLIGRLCVFGVASWKKHDFNRHHRVLKILGDDDDPLSFTNDELGLGLPKK